MAGQHGEVVAGLGVKAAAHDQGAGQAGPQGNRKDLQERDEAEREHGSELQRAVDEPELA